MNYKPKNFKEFLEMCGATGVIYDKTKPKEDWNWEGTPGKNVVSPSKDPIKNKNEKRSKRK